MARKECRQKVAEMLPVQGGERPPFRETVARREQRLREWDEHVARRPARLRRLTFGPLGREPRSTSG